MIRFQPGLDVRRRPVTAPPPTDADSPFNLRTTNSAGVRVCVSACLWYLADFPAFASETKDENKPKVILVQAEMSI